MTVSPTDTLRLDSVETAIDHIARGGMVVVVDDEDRENEGDLIMAADCATAETIAFFIRYTSGYICVGMSGDACDRLGLPPMVAINQDQRHTAYTVTVDASHGVTTGISAHDRAHTIRLLGNAQSTAADFIRPGHVLPLRARNGGVLTRDGHTEAGMDLARLAGKNPAGALCEIVSQADPTEMARGPELRQFADEHNLPMISIAALQQYRRTHESQVTQVAETILPTDYGTFRTYAYRDDITGMEHVALAYGDIGSAGVLTRIHSECLTGDIFGSHRCDCGPQLHSAMQRITEEGSGVIVYLRGHEGRGIGLANKLRAYRLQDEGLDTVDANLHLGLPADARNFAPAAQILRDLGVSDITLLSNNPLKREQLDDYGVTISAQKSLTTTPTGENLDYLRTKRDRMGHTIDNLPADRSL